MTVATTALVPSRLAVGGVLAAAIFMAASCSEPPAGPTPLPPVQQPPVVPAPVINTLNVSAVRAEAGEDVTVSAGIEDGAPALGVLTYFWSATAGSISGSGSSVSWRLAPGSINTGTDVTISLTVTKPYQVLENGALVNREHRVTKTAAAFRVHDSVNEISRITLTFLIDYFGNPQVGPDACLVDFSASCPGREAERKDIVDNRADRRITSVEARIGSVTLNAAKTFARVAAPCTFRDINLSTGRPFASTGTCELTAVYEQQRWWLCDSNYVDWSEIPAAARHGAERQQGGRYWDADVR